MCKSSCHEQGLRLSIEEAFSSAVRRFGLGKKTSKKQSTIADTGLVTIAPSLLAEYWAHMMRKGTGAAFVIMPDDREGKMVLEYVRWWAKTEINTYDFPK